MVSYKVDYNSAWESEMTFMHFLTSADNLGMTETGIREIIGRIFYLLKD